jgi:hypothetical protein
MPTVEQGGSPPSESKMSSAVMAVKASGVLSNPVIAAAVVTLVGINREKMPGEGMKMDPQALENMQKVVADFINRHDKSERLNSSGISGGQNISSKNNLAPSSVNGPSGPSQGAKPPSAGR